jgi:glycosyltransferase involved in cell wall biosynthesis
MTPRISVVIPAYNNAMYIADTVRSVLNQTYEDFELIVADHSSSDETAEVLESFQGNPKLCILPPTPKGGGAVANWNRVSRAATGEWIKLVCGDDLLDPGALAKQIAAVDDHPSAVMVASQRRIVDAKGREIIAARGLAGLTGLVDGRDATRATVRAGTNLFGEPVCVLLRRDQLEAVEWWTDAYPYLLDEASYVNVLLHGDLVAIQEPLASFRISTTQWSVRLAKLQSDHAAGFHRELRKREPGLLSDTDVLIGNLKARRSAYGRRLIYAWLDRRMRREHGLESRPRPS